MPVNEQSEKPSSLSIFNLTLPTKPNDRKHWGNLHGSASALAIVEAAIQHEGLLLVVTSDTSAAYRLEEEIAFFLNGEVLYDLNQTMQKKALPLLSLPF